MDIESFLRQVCEEVESSAGKYIPLLRENIPNTPIPFFGKINSASVLTVGVNPSPGEFEDKRLPYWEKVTDPVSLSKRLSCYFNGTHHQWFDTWRAALDLLNVSYESGTAAHVDLSPRATIPMAQIHDTDLFLDMIRQDMKWFYEILTKQSSIKLVLLAGSVTKIHYINDFVKKYASEHGYRLEGFAQKKGNGRVGAYEFISNKKKIKCFYCSVSPSYRKPGLLIERIKEYDLLLNSLIHDTKFDE